MTDRLYYLDTYATHFEARVLEQSLAGNLRTLILDRTLFYPTSGGQPHDLGMIAGLSVVSVSIRAKDGAIEHHVLGELPAGRSIHAEIDWTRRFDHMQQHSAQHILSQAFLRLAETETIGFHLGDEAATIDLDRADLTPVQIEQAETLANEIVWENRPLRIHFVDAADAAAMPLRKVPPIDQGKLRVIEIADFDWSACGGTHVSFTGELGLIKIVRLERRGQKLRLTFLAGGRALGDYRRKNLLVNRLMGEFTTGQDDLLPAVERLRTENDNWRRQSRRQHAELARMEATLLRRSATARSSDNATLVVHAFEGVSPDYLRQVVTELVAEPGTIALCGLAAANAQLVFARSDDVSGDMSQLLKAGLQVLGTTAGGGSGSFAQGGGTTADLARVQTALARAARVLLARSKAPDTRR